MSKKIFEDYTEVTNYKLLHKTPIIIHFNGRGFKRVSSLLDKPFSYDLSKCFQTALYKCCIEFEGCVFGYQFNDEFIFILRNDQHKETVPWYDNSLQKILSSTTSILTYNFTLSCNSFDLSLVGDPIFIGNVFNVSKSSDCINYLIFSQNKNFIHSLNLACEYELLKLNFNKDYIYDLIKAMSVDDKKDLLLNTCNIDFLNYPIEFRRGVGCYRVKKEEKNKWVIDNELNIFYENINMLSSIISV